jgi:hypothetical protein
MTHVIGIGAFALHCPDIFPLLTFHQWHVLHFQ